MPGWPTCKRSDAKSRELREKHAMTQNIDAVRGFLEAQYAGDFDGAFDRHANPEFTWAVGMSDNVQLTTAIPWAGRRLAGADGYRTLTGELFGEFESLLFDPRRFSDVGDAVYVEGYFRFRHRRTGRIAEADFCARFDMRDGRISGGQFYENTYAVAAARLPATGADGCGSGR
jgi:ketosteroid isomerase-like protein